MASEGRRTLACAIYTRKSSEEGLEQEFNSLDAQREACEAFILSQKHEGWRGVSTLYDDGGFSGGNMDRPALRRLMDDIRVGKINVVVVYKVDRLTRALSDFAKMVEVFDAQGVSFVSVTQQFNTTTSMGRLTLNVLLSFAQFEREVTGERIRDKIAASKKKGMFMGGGVPLGYDHEDHRLVVNEVEAGTVRKIFDLYLDLRCARRVQAEATRLGIVSKVRTNATGRVWGGKQLTRGHLYYILKNRTYLGEILHKGQIYDGQHTAIRRQLGLSDQGPEAEVNGFNDQEFTISVPVKLTRFGRQKRMIIGNDYGQQQRAVNDSMVLAVARATTWDQEIRNGMSLRQIAKRENLSAGYVTRIMPLAFLAPDIVQAICDGRQPASLKVKALSDNLPLEWVEQRRKFGFPAH